MRTVRRVAVWLLLLLVVAGGAVLGLALSSLPQTEGTLALPGLSAPVDIRRDARGIPHIKASTLPDAWFAVGVVHAQDRLFQLEMTRRIGSGRLAEAVGSAGLDTDRLMRTLGLRRLAEAQLPGLSPDTRAALEAYAAGVNALVTHSGRALPPEFLALGVDFTPWTPVDSLLWARLMALRLSGDWRTEAIRLTLEQTLPRAEVDALWPTAPMGEQAINGMPESWVSPLASNAWAVDGRRSARGAPVLAGDPHLELGLPAVWYLVDVTAPGLTLRGATAPGVPAVLVGTNGTAAWTFTTTHGDSADLVRVRLTPDGTAVLTPSGQVPLQIRNETIHRRNGADESLTVRETPHGPLVGAFLQVPLPPDSDYALSATALLAQDRTPDAVFALNRATTWPQAREALALWGAPMQTVLYADTAGTIAQQTVGRVPKRRKGGDGRWPADAASGAGTWDGWVPFSALPRVEAPTDGLLVNANERPPGPGAAALGVVWPPPWRAERIRSLLLRLDHPATPADMAAIQADVRSGWADVLLPRLLELAAPVNPEGQAAVARLAAWDRAMDIDSAEAPLFLAWVVETSRQVFLPRLGDAGWKRWGAQHPETLARALADPHQAEANRRAVSSGLESALVSLRAVYGPPETWRWGDMHRAALGHPLLSKVPGLAWLSGRTPATPGGPETVNRGTSPLWRDGLPWSERFQQVHGPSLRFIIDLAAPEAAHFVLAGGQSGHPLSPFYADQVRSWATGQGDDKKGAADKTLRLDPMPTGRP